MYRQLNVEASEVWSQVIERILESFKIPRIDLGFAPLSDSPYLLQPRSERNGFTHEGQATVVRLASL